MTSSHTTRSAVEVSSTWPEMSRNVELTPTAASACAVAAPPSSAASSAVTTTAASASSIAGTRRPHRLSPNTAMPALASIGVTGGSST
jgi:hypothetical protein